MNCLLDLIFGNMSESPTDLDVSKTLTDLLIRRDSELTLRKVLLLI